ncbi:MAG: hypothetical protein QXY62_02675 [Candidatus Altiarchaeota archaeon]
MIKFKIFILILSSLVITFSANASFISLSTQILTENLVHGNETDISVKITNFGDETAYDVIISLMQIDGFNSDAFFLGDLAPNVPYNGNINLRIQNAVLPGEYPIILLTEYKDANGYGFSSVSGTSLFLRERAISKIFSMIEKIEISLDEEKELKLKIRNTDARGHNTKVRLFLPKELKADVEEAEIFINPKEEKEQTFKISSFGALPGSTYVVFAAVEYEDSMHFSSLSSGVVKVVEKKEKDFEFLEIPKISNFISIPGAILVILIALFVLYQFKKENGKKKGSQKKRK